jgi:hypothetical protein
VVAGCGRAAIVWLGLAIIAAAEHPLGAGGLVAVSIAAAIWLVGLRIASASAPYALGPWVPAAIGTASGLVCVMAVNPYPGGLGLSLAALCSVAAGIFLSVGTWETVLERTAQRRVLVIGTEAVAESSASAASMRPRISAARAASSRPAGVSRIPRPTRCSSCAPVSASSRPRWWVTEGWE